MFDGDSGLQHKTTRPLIFFRCELRQASFFTSAWVPLIQRSWNASGAGGC